jgi:hypothetical protein
MPKEGYKGVTFSVPEELERKTRKLAATKPRGWLSERVTSLLRKLTKGVE